MMGLLAPALLASAAGLLGGKQKGRNQDRRERVLPGAVRYDCCRYAACHLHEAEETVSRMAEMMQALFPILLTLLAAVGGSHGAALLEPAVSAASGIVTALVRGVSLRLSTGVAVVTLLDHLSPRMRLSRLAGLLRTGSNWLLGVASAHGFPGGNVIAGADRPLRPADGISIRAAKYAVDDFVPDVGGMFADTMDTLVGCSLLIKNAVGVTGLALLLSAAAVPSGPHAVRGDDLSALRRAFAACFAVQDGRSFAGFFGCVDAVVYHSAIGQRHVCVAGGAGVGGGQRHGGAKIK